MSLSQDEQIFDQMKLYFSVIRNKTSKNSIPEKIENEIIQVVKYSMKSTDSFKFLIQCGLIFFDKCIGVNTLALSKIISSSKSRIASAFRREHWESGFNDEMAYRQLLRDVVKGNEIKFWSLRKYPDSATILKVIRSCNNIVYKRPQLTFQSPEKKIDESREAFELTLQMDIFSWTFFDEF